MGGFPQFLNSLYQLVVTKYVSRPGQLIMQIIKEILLINYSNSDSAYYTQKVWADLDSL